MIVIIILNNLYKSNIFLANSKIFLLFKRKVKLLGLYNGFNNVFSMENDFLNTCRFMFVKIEA